MQSNFLKLLLLLAILGYVSPLGKLDSRIVGGLPANDVSTPYVVSLVYFGSHICGGSIINERTVLTAAHCILFPVPSLLKVHVGSKSLSRKEGQMVRVSSIHKNPHWNRTTSDYDIAVVRLARPLKYSPTVQPIRLPTQTDLLENGDYVSVFGWGLTEMNGQISDILRYARVPIVDQAHCNELLGGLITDRMFCAGYEQGGIDTCQSDSGGPLVKENKLFGIVSWGIGCALPNKPGVYARVQTLLPWVNETLRMFGENI